MICRDASFGTCTYNLTLLDCLHGIHKVSTGNLDKIICIFVGFIDLKWVLPVQYLLDS